MTPIEIIATIFSVLLIVKFLYLKFNPRAWKKFSDKIMKKPKVTKWIYLVLALVIGYYLLQELNVVQIVAVMMFSGFLTGYTFMTFAKEFKPVYKEIWKNKEYLVQKLWPAWLIYLVLAGWVLWTVFGP